MEPDKKFPVLTGLRISSLPEVWDGKLYLCDQDGKVHTVDANGIQNTWETSFFAALRSPPSFISISSGRTAQDFAAVYPKTFFGEIWLLDTDGKTLPDWPASLSDVPSLPDVSSGIGFGSPLLFERGNRLHIAFVSQAGELFVFDENAALIPPFPLVLDGVFFHQPVFDGEFLWLISSDGTLFKVGLDGQVLYQRINNFSVKEEGYITVFDSDGDKIPEIFITGEGNALHGYSRNFRSLEGFPLPVWGRPLFVGGDGRGKPEVIGIGMDRRLYRWQFK
jgi:outer membrane protein assembly factor BamB